MQASFIFALNSQRLLCDCNKICVTCKKSLIFKTLIDNDILFACRESLGDCIYVSFYLIISQHKQLLSGTPELGGQEGQLPPLPFAGRGKGGKSAL